MRQSPLFSTVRTGEVCYDEVRRASYKGIGAKTFILLGVSIIVAVLTAVFLPQMLMNNYGGFYALLIASSIIGTIAVFVGRLNYNAAKYAGVIYSACEGVFLGTLTALVELYAPGIATIAVFSTLVIFSVMAILFFSGILRVGTKFRRFIFAFSLCALSLVLFVSLFSLFGGGIQNWGALVLIEGVLLLYGVLTLLLDFDEARFVVDAGAEKNAEWTVALGMVVSLIYIYVQLLRFLLLFVRDNN
ncbi:MAG: Bax inhibitor-1/YccA family protein [Anaeroplasma sp.]